MWCLLAIWVCLSVFVTVFVYSFSLMVKPRQQEFGWNRQQIAEVFSLAAISVAFLFAFYRRDLWPLRAAKDHRVFHDCFGSTKGLVKLSIERFKTVQRLG